MSDRPQRPPEQPERAPGSILDALAEDAGGRPRVRLWETEGGEAAVVGPAGPSGAPSRYEIRGLLGEGGMGQVFKAHDQDLGRDVALKFLHERHRSQPGIVRRFLEEAQIGAQLQHPGIVPVYELGLAQRRPFFAMKLVKGETLAQRLAGRAHPLDDLQRNLAAFERVCQTVAYAHARGVIHRDLKPDNVVIGGFGEVQVLDWGMSKVLPRAGEAGRSDQSITTSVIETVRSQRPGSQSIAGSVLGTPAYMAPEQALGEVDAVDARSDVFGLGAMLCELLTGQPPYVGRSTTPGERQEEQMVMAAHADLEDAKARLGACGADRALVELTLSCLAREAAARPSDAREVAARVGAYLAEAEARAHAAMLQAQTARQRQRYLVAIAALVVVALGVSLWWWRSAEQALDRFDLVAKVVKLRELERRAAELYPAVPSKIEDLKAWLREADPFAAELDRLRASLGELRAAASLPTQDARAAEVAPLAAPEREASWADPTLQFLHDTLAQLVSDLAEFSEPERGVPADVRRRLQWAERVEERSLGRCRERWQAARAAIAGADGATASERYRRDPALQLAPQLGLVPIGMNPRTKLWEFYDLASAEDPDAPPPAHDRDGRIAVTGETGMVFALLPGGTFWMGAGTDDPSQPNHDPLADRDESPVHEVTLAPFFISRFEMTRGQWRRLAGGDEPSWFTLGKTYSLDPRPIGYAHPVENLSWDKCAELLRRHGLLLPTEALWEYGCRAGTTTRWWTGDQADSLAGACNMLDRSGSRGQQQSAPGEAFDDGFAALAPVGWFAANAFGLHDVHGNVWEWTQDEYGSYSRMARPGDGLRPVPAGSTDRVPRGGGFLNPARLGRSSHRYRFPPGGSVYYLGVRPARGIDR